MPFLPRAWIRPFRHIPSLCAVCQGWGAQRVCSACLQRFTPPVLRCECCAVPVPLGTAVCGQCITQARHATLRLSATLAAVDYRFPWDGLIQRFKFHGGLDLSAVLAECLAQAVMAAQCTPRSTALTPPEVILPIPLSAARLQARGYNQAWELARRVAHSLATPARADWLLRVKDTPHQLALPPPEREANVRGAFVIEPLQRAALRGRHIALIDDVMTTGATLREAAGVLHDAGAASVQAWVLARTPLGP